jgi:NitT/TauT family transport system substrate-binding protein
MAASLWLRSLSLNLKLLFKKSPIVWRLVAITPILPALVAVLLLWGLGLGCSPAAAPSADAPRNFSLGYLTGAQDFIIFVMDSQKLLERYHLQPDRKKFLNPPSVQLMIAENQVDIGFGGFTTMANARAQGKDVIIVRGIFSPVNAVFVPLDSPIKSVADLRGKKMGSFGGPGSTTLAFFGVIASKWYGLDIFRDVEQITAPGPALDNLLERGEIDAALMGTMESIRFTAQKKYRVLADLSEEYQARQGRAPAHVMVSTSEQFAREHPDIIKDFLRAYEDALQFSKNNPEVWAAYGKTVGMTAEPEIALLREKMSANLIERWDEEQIATQQEYLRFVQSVLGERVFGAIPEGLMRDDFNP